jgi:regulator of protease activity HflC (stomatin/prohibitin superfamily)
VNRPANQNKGVPMLVKLIIAAVISGFIFSYPPTSGFAVPFFILAIAVIFIIEGVRVVPQQNAWVVERLGKFHGILEPGLNIIVPFIDRVQYRHSLKEVPLDVPEQTCITKDNTQLSVDGILYYQVTDPKLASYGTSDYVLAITQLAQTTLRSEVGKMELDKTFESRDEINHKVVAVLDEAGRTWGVKVLRYEIKNLTPPEAILHAMQAQITAEREKRALIAKSEGQRQQEINLADGERQAKILESEGDKTAAINKAQGEATAVRLIAEAQAEAVRVVGQAIGSAEGLSAANLKVAELYVDAFKQLAKAGNTLIVPSNLNDAAGFIASAMTVLDRAKAGTEAQKAQRP